MTGRWKRDTTEAEAPVAVEETEELEGAESRRGYGYGHGHGYGHRYGGHGGYAGRHYGGYGHGHGYAGEFSSNTMKPIQNIKIYKAKKINKKFNKKKEN